MPTSEQFIVIGVFDDVDRADESIDALQQAGYSSDQIRRSARQESRPKGLKGLFSGTSHENLTNDLIDMGVDSEDAHHFQKEYEAGHPLVSVEGRGDMQNAVDILVAHGAHGPERRGEGREYGEERPGGTSGVTGERYGAVPPVEPEERVGRPSGRAETRPGEVPSPEMEEARRLRLHSERLRAYKRPVKSGEVSVRKEVVTEQQTVNVPVSHEELVIERRSLAGDAAAAEGDQPIGEGEEIRIPLREEQAHVTKEAVATGEVEIGKRQVTENRQFTEEVRHEEPYIEKEGEAPIIDTGMNRNPDQPQI